jgi:hypothetical protein
MKRILGSLIVALALVGCTPVDDARNAINIINGLTDAGTHDAGGTQISCSEILACANSCASCSASCEANGTTQAKQYYDLLNACVNALCPGTNGGGCTRTDTTCATCVAGAESGSCSGPFQACIGDVTLPDAGQPDNDGGSDNDAGTHDAGPRDGGTDGGTHDAGPSGGAIGAACINNNTGTLEQSTCANSLLCLPLSVENTTLDLCTKDCTSNSDCGAGNSCWSGICWQACTVGVTQCAQGSFNCQPFSTATDGLCLPDCAQEAASFCTEFFGYPFNSCTSNTSDPAYGACTAPGGGATCGPTMACASGEYCYPVPGTNGAASSTSVCVNDCTVAAATSCSANTDCESDSCVSGHCAACPNGFSCSSSTRTCQITHVANYGKCAFTGQCNSGVSCITFGAGLGECLPPCTSDAQCASVGNTTGKCALDLTNGSKVCALDCSASGSVCPANEACAAVQGLGSFCFPQ